MAEPQDALKLVQDSGAQVVDIRFVDLPGLDAALLDAGFRAHRGELRGRTRLRRLVDPRVPGDPGVGHDPDPGPGQRVRRPVPGAPDGQHQLLRQGPGDRRVVHARPAQHRPQGRGVPEGVRHRRRLVLGSGARVLHLRLDPLRPEPALRLLLHRRGRRASGTRDARRRAATRDTSPATRRATSPSRRWTTTRTCGPR